MTAQLLTSELSTLIQESKRKNPDLRSAADKSLNDLKNLPRTSEAQIAADLKSRPSFVTPFLIACRTRNSKFAGSGIVGLQRLVVANALPKQTLTEVLEAFRECASLALDIQLKVLQALPSLLQNYAKSLTGRLLVAAFEVCFLLYNNKTAVVSNTAAASLQQLVNTTFDKAADDDNEPSRDEPSVEVSIGDGDVSVYGTVLDAYQILEDICLLTEGQRPNFVLAAALAQNFGLELLESILANHADTVVAHPEQIHVLRSRLMPLIVKILSERTGFSTTVRTMRLLHLIISRLLFALAPECEMALSLLNHMHDPDAAAPWKRALCLELFRGIHSEPTLVRSIYAYFDEADEKRNIIRDHLGALVRLAAEKPQIIGLGQQSSIPTSNQGDDPGEQAALQAGGLVGSFGAPVTSTDMNRLGIGVQWSTVRTPCIEQLDKSEPPNLPATYIYSLGLTCITRFSEGLARFLLPFTVPIESKAKRRHPVLKEVEGNENTNSAEKKTTVWQSFGSRRLPVNPMSLREHVLYSQISTSAHMVDHCWPALLAASSTYLNATMDLENYHTLIRSFQKFTQIAGLLDLATPRDAFLTTLGKHAAPAIKGTAPSPQPNGRDPTFREDLTDSDRDLSPAPSPRQQSTDATMPNMNTRHLLCLRALLNLGIALGPVLKRSWTIILETLLQADLIISSSGKAGQKRSKRAASKAESEAAADKADGTEDLGLEVTAVETAASRLFESTADLPNEAFLDFVECLCSLLQIESPLGQPVDGLLSPSPASRKHQKARSVSGVPREGEAVVQSNGFVIDKLDDVIQSNVARMLQPEISASGWEVILEVLTSVLGSGKARSDVRIKAANAYNELVVAVAISDEPLPRTDREDIRGRSLYALGNELSALHESHGTKASRDCDIEIHRLALEALKAIIDSCGDSLEIGWGSVLAIINSIFEPSSPETRAKRDDLPASYKMSPNPKLVRSAFGSLQLICSDFLSSVPPTHLLSLLDTLYFYCVQDQDLNISLTTATLFRNVSDFLHRDNKTIKLIFLKSVSPSSEDLARWAKCEDPEKAISAMWLYLLYRITLLSMDSRLEVRHSALHTLFRIFDASSEQLTTEALHVCFETVLEKLLKTNVMQYHHAEEAARSEPPEDTTGGWNETAIVEIEGVSALFAQWLDTYRQDKGLAIMCKALFENYTEFLKRRTLSVSNAIFAGTNKILLEIGNNETVEQSLLQRAWELWRNGNPAKHVDCSQRQSGNQDATMSYLECLRQILRLTGEQRFPDRAKLILKELHVCVVHSSATAYSPDVDRMTLVQSLVLECVKSITAGSSDMVEALVQSITGLITLAYEQKRDTSGRELTYVALSKAAMGLLESYVFRLIKEPGVNVLVLVFNAGKALAIPVHLKYKWQAEGKEPPPWSKATTTALSILEASLSVVQIDQDTKQESSHFWEIVVKISDGIVAADCDACNDWTAIPKDQAFDIEAFSRIRKLMVPALGSFSIPDTVRRKFAESVFQHSLIHEPHVDDLARPGQELLEGLRSTHIGRVNDLPPSPRSKISYLLLDELFSLVAVHDGSPERIRLAQAAAPYLILRAGLTLKAYVMDNPLRGRMPQPWSQKKELLYILRKLVDLDSEPRAIPAAPGVTSEHKKHLHRLYGLLMKALKAAWRDDEIQEAVREVLDAVGDDFGL